MKRLINSIILFVVAVILSFILFPLSFVVTMVVRFDKYFLSDFFYSLALGIDKVGNVVLQVPLNAFAVKSNHATPIYYFGNINDTISYALAMNWKRDNLSNVGWMLVDLLEWLDAGHMDKSLNRRY